MNILEILLKAAEADVTYALEWFERTGDPEWHEIAKSAQAQAENFRHSLRVSA